MTQATSSTITTSDLNTKIDGEPRVLDVLLGARLGMAAPRNLRTKIKENASELALYGKVCTETMQTSMHGGRPGVAYYLNEPQALLLCMFANTPAAASVRKMLIDVFMAFRHGSTVTNSIDSEIQIMRQMVRDSSRRAVDYAEDVIRLHDAIQDIARRCLREPLPVRVKTSDDVEAEWAKVEAARVLTGSEKNQSLVQFLVARGWTRMEIARGQGIPYSTVAAYARSGSTALALTH
ncbi:hypothetical protein [Mesorhizobium sp.]|uniref:hypothetical protein n=1 Tax=Mesorhizobium sp. TaxID=1871066 RepID=UPI000FEA0310|nr:hypothetical protein [Mesorhizobium sp.]RWO20643.1 MAG: hypothetical protein EOS09_26345 [Mesorhizobium sp.]